MTNWTKPSLTSTYTDFITELKYRDEVVGSLYSTDLSPAPSNLPVDTSTDWGKRSIRWNASNNYFERRNAANNNWERLEGNSGTHKFVNLEAVNITGTGTVLGDDVTATDQVQGSRLNVTGSTAPANGLYRPAANEIALATNSTPRLTIESNGEVGIANQNPEYTLDITGTFRIQNGSNDSYLEVGTGGSGNRNAYIDLVGDGTYTDYGFRIIRGNSGANSNTQLIHRGTDSFILATNEAADMLFKTSNTIRFVVDSGGNCGIGNFDNPSHNFHIKRTDASGTYIRLQNSEGSAYLGADGDALQLFGDTVYLMSEAGSQYLASTSSLFDIKTAAKVNGNLQVTGTVTGTFSGNGASLTSIPYSALTGTPTIPTAVTNNNQLTNGAGYTTYTANQSLNTSNSPTFEAMTLNGGLTVNANDNSSTIVMADSDNGNRSIHNNSNYIGFLKQDGNLGAYCDDSGNWTAVGNITAYSDERLKENIKTIPNALETVKKLRGVSFDRKDFAGKGIGVIAQEIEQVLPEVVVEGEYKSVSYGNIVGLLIEAIKELEKKHKHGL